MLFKRLRNQIMLMNLGFITILMIIAFSVLYGMTWSQIWDDIEMDLSRATDIRFSQPDTPAEIPGTDVPERHGKPVQDVSEWSVPPELISDMKQSISFTLILDAEEELVSINSIFSEEEDFYGEAYAALAESSGESGVTTLDGSRWAYLLKEYGDVSVAGFVNIDGKQAILDRLLLTFAGVAAGSLLLIFALSYFLTKRSLKPAEESFARQKAFVAHASHELKTPIAVIGANAELLEGDSEAISESGHKRLTYIRDEVKRMTKLTSDLLYLASLDEGRRRDRGNSSALFNLSDAVESHLLGMEALMFERRLRLKYQVESEIWLDGVREQILQVLVILLDNAVTYAEEGSEVLFSLSRTAGRIRLEVTNSGEGISPEESRRIFDRFYRGDAARSRSASHYGLGLSIAQSIVHQHKGTIECTSIPHKTTTFTVKLPAARKS